MLMDGDAFETKGAIFKGDMFPAQGKLMDFFTRQRSGSLTVLCVRQTTLMQYCGERRNFQERCVLYICL